MKPTQFNIRVYGLWVNENWEVLLVDELIKCKKIVKFPGGGLEFGEGVADCMIREWREETGQELAEMSHFYTTDFYQQSFYNPVHQIISVYYLVTPAPNQPLIQETGTTEIQGFRFQALEYLDPLHLSLPIDQKAAELLIKHFLKK